MEAVIVVEQHRNQYYGRIEPHGPARFESPPSRDFRGMNCRSFQSGAGILPTPLKACISGTKHVYPSSPKTPPTCLSSNAGNGKQLASVKSAPIPITAKFSNKNSALHEEFYDRNFSFSELWAGPTYSNSPPPSSLPIPKFSVAKRTKSLELPRSAPEFEMHRPSAKSAPPSPTRELESSSRFIFHSADSATKTLRRILNLDVDNE
ncbi:hypothetical protein SDJN03_28192, partial [Cucurbita argyrosperma subsp. sororia]